MIDSRVGIAKDTKGLPFSHKEGHLEMILLYHEKAPDKEQYLHSYALYEVHSNGQIMGYQVRKITINKIPVWHRESSLYRKFLSCNSEFPMQVFRFSADEKELAIKTYNEFIEEK